MTIDISKNNEPAGGIGDVVAAVRELGERARLLAVNLAVATAKLRQAQPNSSRTSDELLDLVARVTRVSHEVSDAVNAVEKGLAQTRPASPALWDRWQSVGVPDEKSLERLSQTLHETLDLAGYVFRLLRKQAPAGTPEPPHWDKVDPTWADDGGAMNR